MKNSLGGRCCQSTACIVAALVICFVLEAGAGARITSQLAGAGEKAEQFVSKLFADKAVIVVR